MNTKEINEVLESRFEKRFGDIAVSKRFVNLDQLIQAMSTQVKEESEKGEHILLGEILINKGFMDKLQVQDVLEEMQS